jgi:hypothetical protein
VLAIDNAGTVELAVVNISGGNQLDETNLISTTAEGGAGAADSANVIYSATARTNVPYRVVGFIDSTQTTAGTWATAPSTIQGVGGQALTALSSIGYGQTWQSPSRSSGTTYYNTTGKPIFVCININPTSSGNAYVDFLVDGVNRGTWGQGSSASPNSLYYSVGTFIIPSGSSYRANLTGSVSLYLWQELR